MLANADRLGDTAFFVAGPIAIFFALVVWVTMTLMTSRHRFKRRPPRVDGGMPRRGIVQGGVLQGSPSQRNRRDPIPSVTDREVMRQIEDARERQAREIEEARSQGQTTGRKKPRRAGRRFRRHR